MTAPSISLEESLELGAEARIVGRILGFARLLRDNGFLVGVQEELDALRLAALNDAFDARRVRSDLRALLCSDASDWERYEALFEAYWRRPNRKGTVRASGSPPNALLAGDGAAPHGGLAAEADHAGDSHDDGAAAPDGTRGGASARDSVARGDFRFITDETSMRATEELVERLARRMSRRLARRMRLDTQGRRIHLRRTLRKSLRYGGVPLDLAYRRRHRELPRLVLLLDVSRSMSLYSFLLLRFARGLVGAFRDAEVFVFHTRLVHITEALKESDLRRVREKLAVLSLGWSGGTCIGESLQAFEHDYAGRLLTGRTVVIVMSDGFDTGEPAQLAEALRRIRARAWRLVWLNPLLGREGYEPLAGGMQAALPLLDRFLPAHDLPSLEALEHELAAL
jgi:uncharacterized protein with von Willebrand factor type A (vWA) domain